MASLEINELLSSTIAIAETPDTNAVTSEASENDHIIVEQPSEKPVQTATQMTEDVEMVGAGVPERQSLVLPTTLDPTEAHLKKEVESEATTGDREMLDREFIEVAQANRDDPQAEFEADSDPELSDDSSDSSDSDSDDSSSDDDSDDGSAILDPAEAARILMRASPEEGGAAAGPPRTVNEQQEESGEIPVIPNIHDILIVELGEVTHIIAATSCVVIKAKVHVNHNVLQPGSALCLADRTIIRPISDTIAQVQEPYYVVYFQSINEIRKFGIQEGTMMYYPDDVSHRNFVFTEELRKQKHTDASNIYDEEVNDNEKEFSDDEQEAAHRRLRKEDRQHKSASKVHAKSGAVVEADDAEVGWTRKPPPSATGGRGGRGRGSGVRAGLGARSRPSRYEDDNIRPGSSSGYVDPDADPRPKSSHIARNAQQPTVSLNYDEEPSTLPSGDYHKLTRPDRDISQNAPPPRNPVGSRSRGDHRFGRGSGRGNHGGSSDLGGHRGGHNDYRPHDHGGRGRNNQRDDRGRGGQFQQTPISQMQTPASLPPNQPFYAQAANPWIPPPPPPPAAADNVNGQNSNSMYQQGSGVAHPGGYPSGYGNQNMQGSIGATTPWVTNANAQGSMNMPPQYNHGNVQHGMNMPQFHGGNAQHGMNMPSFNNRNAQMGMLTAQFNQGNAQNSMNMPPPPFNQGGAPNVMTMPPPFNNGVPSFGFGGLPFQGYNGFQGGNGGFHNGGNQNGNHSGNQNGSQNGN
jgi:rRNA processing protein Gar1